jgi:hypothetical protein
MSRSSFCELSIVELVASAGFGFMACTLLLAFGRDDVWTLLEIGAKGQIPCRGNRSIYAHAQRISRAGSLRGTKTLGAIESWVYRNYRIFSEPSAARPDRATSLNQFSVEPPVSASADGGGHVIC